MRTFFRTVAVSLAIIVMVGCFVGKSSAASTPRRYTAMHFALAQAGKPYRYGATGPSSFDCSGLVLKAYAKAGISLPRTANDMYHSSKLSHISAGSARWGDLIFWISGGHAYHVELATTKRGVSFGAHHSGTRISYRGFSGRVYFAHVKAAG
jgi:hypothetical protein